MGCHPLGEDRASQCALSTMGTVLEGGGLEHLRSLSVHGRPLYFIFTVNTLVNDNKGVLSMLLEV